jgi:hypothetical protein
VIPSHRFPNVDQLLVRLAVETTLAGMSSFLAEEPIEAPRQDELAAAGALDEAPLREPSYPRLQLLRQWLSTVDPL